MESKLLKKYNSKPLQLCQTQKEASSYNGLGELNIGFLELDFAHETLYVNQFLLALLEIDTLHDITLQSVLLKVMTKDTYSKFVSFMTTSKKGNKVVEFHLSMLNGLYFDVKMRNNDISEKLIVLFEQKSLYQKNMLSDLLDNVPLPIFCTDYNKNVRYNNQLYTSKFVTLHNIIESLVEGHEIDFSKYDFIEKFELFNKTKDSYIYNVFYDDLKISITRKIVEIENEKCMMYIHQTPLKNQNEDERLKKILKVNELTIEIKDMVDNVSDLHEMFNYLLSQIHTVIPFAKRSCILRVDEDENMFMDSKYNYSEEYLTEFSIPFRTTYAYMNIADDYSKSVIVNDVQEKYSDLFPHLQGKTMGLRIESNVATPLVVGGVLYGIVSVDSDQNHVFDDVDLNLLDFLKVQIERGVEKHNQMEIIKRNSNIDPMTGISNRRHLELSFAELAKKSKINDTSFLLVIFDLDKLKYINDTFGHLSGDITIKQFTFVIQKQIRDTDLFARIGGDEFVGVFQNVEEEVLVRRINSWTSYFNEHPNKYLDQLIPTAFSYGISKYPVEGSSFKEVLEVADKRMYAQKRSKKK